MSITGANNPFSCTPVVFSAGNQILQLGTITRDGNEFTFSVGFKWKINGVTYQNTAPIVLTISEASEGFYRIDNAILNTSNSIELQQGLESETIALQPVVADTNILLTSWNISGDTVGDTSEPILGSTFKKKSEAAAYNDPTLTGANAVIPLQPNGQSVYAFSNAGLTSIDGFGLDLITGNSTAEVPYDGKDILIYNNKAGNLTLKHDGSGSADVKFLLEGGVDLVIPAGGKVWLKYGPSYCEMIFKSWSEVDISGKLDKSTTPSSVYATDRFGGQEMKPISDFYKLNQVTITTSRNALESDNGCLVKIKGNATYTINTLTLPTGWNVIVRTFAGATATFVADGSTTFDAPTGLILKPLKMCSIIKDSDDYKILINGETSLT